MLKKSFFILFLPLMLLQPMHLFSIENDVEDFQPNTFCITPADVQEKSDLIFAENAQLTNHLIEKIEQQSDHLAAIIQHTEVIIGQNNVQVDDPQTALEALNNIKSNLISITDKALAVANPTLLVTLSGLIVHATSELQRILTNQNIKKIDDQAFLENLNQCIENLTEKNQTALATFNQEYETATTDDSTKLSPEEQQLFRQFNFDQYKHTMLTKSLQDLKKNDSEIKKLSEQTDNIGFTRLNLLSLKWQAHPWRPTIVKTACYAAGSAIAGYVFLKYIAPSDSLLFGKPIKDWIKRTPNMFDYQRYESLAQTTAIFRTEVTRLESIISTQSDAQQAREQLSQLIQNYKYQILRPSLMPELLATTGITVKFASAIRQKFDTISASLAGYFASFLPVEEDVKIIAAKKDEYVKRAREFALGRAVQRPTVGLQKKELHTDIIGQENLKRIILRIQQQLANPKKVERVGLNRNHGILLYGPSQTGKSHFAQCLRDSLKKDFSNINVQFWPITGTDLMTGRTIGNYISLAQNSNYPVIIWVDEIDKAIGNSTLELKDILSAMTDTSGSNPYPVIVVVATNNPEKLPDSLRRRFNISYPVTRPGLEDRKAFIQIQLQEKRAQGINPVFLEKLAQEMDNCSVVEIKNVFDEAALLAMNSPQNKRLSEFHLQAAFNTEIRGILAAQESDPKKDSITAAYQTSKAFMHSLLRQESLITAVTILPVKAKIDYKPAQEITQDDPNINMQLVSPLEKPLIYHGSVFTAENVSEKEFMSKQDIKNRIFELLAGQAGLKIMLGNTYPDFNPEDNAECFQIISRLVSKGEKATDAAKKMVNERFKQFKQAAEQKLTPHKETLFILSYLLQKRQLVEGADWNSLVEKIKANPKPYAEKILQQPNHASLLVSKFQEIGRINEEKKSTFDSEKK